MPRLVLRRKKPLMKRKVRVRRRVLRKTRGKARQLTGVNTSYNDGYNVGYNNGYNDGHKEGYRQGRYDGEGHNKWKDGVEGLIDTFLPDYEILPDFSAEQIVAAGVEHLRSQWRHLLTPDEIGARILHALDTRAPFSLVRVGDGEILALAQGTVLSVDQVKEQGPFLGYAGIDVPDFEARDSLKESIRLATVVGIPKLRVRNFQPLAFSAFEENGIDFGALTLTDSLINYYLHETGYMSKFVKGRRVLIAGKLAEPLAGIMRQNGVDVVATISPVEGVKDVPRVMGEIALHDFDIALVAAGIAAVLISQRIASDLGKVAIDFGHLANSMIKGEAPFK